MNARRLQIRCATWEQVELFYTRKLRRGNLLSVKVGFAVEAGQSISIGLELPTGIVMHIDGEIRRASSIEGTGKTWIEIDLTGFTDEVLARLKSLVAAEEQPVFTIEADLPPDPDEALADTILSRTATRNERQAFATLTAQLRAMRVQNVADLLGVTMESSVDEVHGKWRNLVRSFHPDTVARFGSHAVTHLAEEIIILVNRAYDRFRQRLVIEGRAAALGSSLYVPHGWLVGFEDLVTSDPPAPRSKSRTGSQIVFSQSSNDVAVQQSTRNSAEAGESRQERQAGVSDSAVAASSEHAGESFEARARGLLGQGESEAAKEMLAMSLVVYPRSRPLRSLYYIAAALSATQAGQLVLATSQLETALAHDDTCREAQVLLDTIAAKATIGDDVLQRLFGARR